MNDEKYDKARRQGRLDRWILLAVAFVSASALIGAVAWHFVTEAARGARDVTEAARGARDNATPAPNVVRPALVPEPTPPPEASLVKEVGELDADVRRLKSTGVIMETNEESLKTTKRLQEATRRLLASRYGPNEPYRVQVVLEYQDTIPDFAEHGADGFIILEMAPSRLQPHSVFSFLEAARQWDGGAFHRNAPHVLQVLVHGRHQPLAFQEYSAEYPHETGTVGYAGRPSGPGWYISIIDNTRNHGPGSQQDKNPYEADSCFGRVVQGMERDVERIKKMPGKEFIDDPHKHVLIKAMRILVPGNGEGSVNGYVEWRDSSTRPG